MRLETITKEYYLFDELDTKAQTKALEAVGEFVGNHWNDNNDEAEWFYDDFNTEWLTPRGFFDIEWAFSGFWSQGDGASFTANLDLATWINKTGGYNKYRRLYNVATGKVGGMSVYECSITRDSWGNYVHDNLMRANVVIYGGNLDVPDEVDQQALQVQAEIQEWAQDKAQELYDALEKHYWCCTGDRDYLLEEIEGHEFEFTIHGDIA
jgi:hypothetical protein